MDKKIVKFKIKKISRKSFFEEKKNFFQGEKKKKIIPNKNK